MVDYDIKFEFIMEIEEDKSIKFDNRYYKSRDMCPKCFIGTSIEKIMIIENIKYDQIILYVNI